MADPAASAWSPVTHLESRPPRPWMLWSIAVAGVVAVGGVITLAASNDSLVRPALQAFLINWIMVPYVASGAIAWWRRPASRMGPLMMATGFSMGWTALQWSTHPPIVSLGHLLDLLPAALILHVFLAFPSGRLVHRFERVLVATCYAAATGVQLVKIALGVNPDSIFVINAHFDLANQIERGQLIAVSLLLLLGTAALIERRREEGVSSRRPLIWLADTFRLSLVMLATLLLAAVQSWTSYETVRHVTFAALGLAPVVFLFALLDARLARSDVGALLVQLRSGGITDLERPLSRALRDPSLKVAYWVEEFGSWADSDGNQVELPRDSDLRRSSRVIHREGEAVAALVFDSSLDDEPELLEAVTAAAAISLEHGRLQAELRARLQELQGSRERLLEAGQQERKRLERNLHDGAQQRLVALSVELGLLRRKPGLDAALAERLDSAQAEVAASLDELRDIARGIYPAVLTGRGLPVALRSLTARAPVPVQLDVDVDGRFDEHVEATVYYVVSESLANIGKHAHASLATVQVRATSELVIVSVSDDGVGGADPEAGSGLRGLADRVETLGGRLRVRTPTGGGTRLEAQIPCR